VSALGVLLLLLVTVSSACWRHEANAAGLQSLSASHGLPLWNSTMWEVAWSSLLSAAPWEVNGPSWHFEGYHM
jgi:hypothetical protein